MRHCIIYKLYYIQVEYMRVTCTAVEYLRHSVTHNTVGYIRDVVSRETLDCIQVEYMRVA